MKKHLVILITYNQLNHIRHLIECIHKLKRGFEIIVIDRYSTDATPDIIKELQKSDPRLHLIQVADKDNACYLKAYQFALDQGMDFIYQFNSDFSQDPKDLINLADQLELFSQQAVIGCRYMGHDHDFPSTPFQRVKDKLAKKYINTWLRWDIKDPGSTLVGLDKASAQTLVKMRSGLFMTGTLFQIATKYLIHRSGYKIKEIPITIGTDAAHQFKKAHPLNLTTLLTIPFLPAIYKRLTI